MRRYTGVGAGASTGMAILEAKLVQQLAHLEQEPFYEVFLHLKKAFNAMDQKRCLVWCKPMWGKNS
jgi:hypothetical protein